MYACCFETEGKEGFKDVVYYSVDFWRARVEYEGSDAEGGRREKNLYCFCMSAMECLSKSSGGKRHSGIGKRGASSIAWKYTISAYRSVL
jgi:hypothetical protein